MGKDPIRKLTFAVAVISILLLSRATWAASTELTFLHRSATREAQWATEIIERFNARNSDVVVRSLPADSGPGGQWYVERLTVLRAAGTAPDVFYGASDKMGFVLKGWALDLTPFVKRDQAELKVNTFFPGVLDSFTLQGKTYGIPLAVTPQLIFYNRDMFNDHGVSHLPYDWNKTTWTWKDMVDYGRKFTKKDAEGVYTQVALSRAGEMHLPDISWIFGGDWFDADSYATGKVNQVTMLRRENIEAYQALLDYYESYAAAGPPKGIDPGGAFTGGKAAMEWIGAWRINAFLATDLGWQWGIGPMPLVQTRANTRWTDPLFVSSTTAHAAEAWRFVKFATDGESQALWTELTGMIPARKVAMDTYAARVSQASGMSPAEVLTCVSGALQHSRRALEESLPDAHMEIVQHMDDWFSPMLTGELAVRSALEKIQAILEGRFGHR